MGAGLNARKTSEKQRFRRLLSGYCLEAVQRPAQPSDRTKEPEPVRPEKRPVLVQLRPWTEPPVRVAPLGLTDPELNSPESDPPEITKRSVLLPHGVPVATATQVPSKLPPPPPLAREARRGSSDAGLARRAGRDDSTSRGFSREPDSDFSSLPMLPPALPDCACAALVGSAAVTWRTQKAILIERRTVHGIIEAFQSFGCALTITASRPSIARCSHPIGGTCRRRSGRTGGRW
jgi:hypothetical protein